MDPKVFSRMTASVLFKATKEYHQRQLKVMFHRYYQPEKGSNWIIFLSEEIISDLRLHVSWELGLNVFDYHCFPRYILGKMIIDIFEKKGELPFIIKALEKNMR